MEIHMSNVHHTVTICKKWTHGPQTASGGMWVAAVDSCTLCCYNWYTTLWPYSIANYHVCIHKPSSCVHPVSLPYMGLNGMCCSPCCNRRSWDATVCPSSMLASAAAQSGWMVLCSCIEVNFAVTILGVARRCRAAQLLNDNLQMQKNGFFKDWFRSRLSCFVGSSLSEAGHWGLYLHERRSHIKPRCRSRTSVEASHDIKSVPRHCLSAWKTSLSACRYSSQGGRVLHTMRRPANSLTVLQIVV